jgi:hypothetical protein
MGGDATAAGGTGGDTNVTGGTSGDSSGTGGTGGASGSSGATSGVGGMGGSATGMAGRSSMGGGGHGGSAGGAIVANGGHNLNDEPSGTPPKLTAGTWVDITPSGVNLQAGCCTTFPNQGYQNNSFGVTWVEIDPSNPYTLYITVDVQGMWKSTDGGTSWKRLGTVPSGQDYSTTVTYLDSPMRVRVDPNDSQHLFATQGVRGWAVGFWESHDGGENWTQPDGFVTAKKTAVNDITTMSIDPVNFGHVLLGSHSMWANNVPAGIMETTDGGATFNLHPSHSGWNGSGSMGIAFFSSPELGIGSSDSWIVSTDGDGTWLTTNAAQDWTQVSMVGTIHGGIAEPYFTKDAVFLGGNNTMLKGSTDGMSWMSVGPTTSDGYYSIVGDGKVLYAQSANTGAHGQGGPEPFLTSPESDGVNWTPYNNGAQTFTDGPYVMRFDKTNGILYAACWGAGVWALKVMP